MFTAYYINRKTHENYFRTVFADDANEAEKMARRYANKGFIVSWVRGHKL